MGNAYKPRQKYDEGQRVFVPALQASGEIRSCSKYAKAYFVVTDIDTDEGQWLWERELERVN